VGRRGAGRRFSKAASAWNAASYASAISAVVLCSSPAATSIRSSPGRTLVAEVPDVGDVLDVDHRDPVVENHPPDEVGQERTSAGFRRGISVDGRPARVHPEPPAVGGVDRLERSGQRVAQAERHRRVDGVIASWSRSTSFG
jgi:hypothetical protein